MNDQSKKNASDLRKQHNSDLIRRMRNGEPLNTVDSKASWYPPRPLIEKDKAEMERVYQGTAGADVQTAAPRGEESKKVVRLARPRGVPPLGEAS
jgi:hypothetical protein